MFLADNLLIVISLHFAFIFAKEVPSHAPPGAEAYNNQPRLFAVVSVRGGHGR